MVARTLSATTGELPSRGCSRRIVPISSASDGVHALVLHQRAIGSAGVDATAHYVSGPYRRETLVGTSHWIPDEEPEKLARLVLEHIAAHG
ncbi:haloalkane dehalogenase [Rhodococcus pyridinivorans AK37]|uniref:Haloalkane dehalogenase n=1 Tax=Rhodococcus pyridinivorans AK37 TaxID=1114960 RepID=H0JS15_9NOCA|nr:haloalkane dehalogenase [Rhodococcus pyridinivorans AK37]